MLFLQEDEDGEFVMLSWPAKLRWGQIVCTTKLAFKKTFGHFGLPDSELERIDTIMNYIEDNTEPAGPASPQKPLEPKAPPKKRGPKTKKTVIDSKMVKVIVRNDYDWPVLATTTKDGKLLAYVI